MATFLRELNEGGTPTFYVDFYLHVHTLVWCKGSHNRGEWCGIMLCEAANFSPRERLNLKQLKKYKIK